MQLESFFSRMLGNFLAMLPPPPDKEPESPQEHFQAQFLRELHNLSQQETLDPVLQNYLPVCMRLLKTLPSQQFQTIVDWLIPAMYRASNNAIAAQLNQPVVLDAHKIDEGWVLTETLYDG